MAGSGSSESLGLSALVRSNKELEEISQKLKIVEDARDGRPDFPLEPGEEQGDTSFQATALAGEKEDDYSLNFDDGTKASSKPDSLLKAVGKFFSMIGNYFGRLFSFPLVREPITFCRPDDFTATGEFDPNHRTSQQEGQELEMLCNYDKATKEIFESILQHRKEALASKDKYHYQALDLSKFPGWDDAVIDRLRSTFQVFDVNFSGLIEFEEFCDVLTEFGDKTPIDEIRKHFDAVDINHSGAIDFEEFITMTYALTVKPEGGVTSLGESYKRIDRNMSRIRSLDVVQQLQAGLF